MPSCPESTRSPDGPCAVPAQIDSARFEDFEGFRETTLAVFTEPGDNQALRRVGNLLYSMGLEHVRYWPREPDGAFFHQMRAVLADLRHLQGWLAHLGRQRAESVLSRREDLISVHCGAVAEEVRILGDSLELAIHPDRKSEVHAPSLQELLATYGDLQWPESRDCACQWLVARWLLGLGAGEGNKRLLREVRKWADAAKAFSLPHVIALEMQRLLRDRGGKVDRKLARRLLAVRGIPAEAVDYYQVLLR
jgi:hypothetical protein